MTQLLDTNNSSNAQIKEVNEQLLTVQVRLETMTRAMDGPRRALLDRVRAQRLARESPKPSTDVYGVTSKRATPLAIQEVQTSYALLSHEELVSTLLQRDDLISDLQHKLRSLSIACTNIDTAMRSPLPTNVAALTNTFERPSWYTEPSRGKSGPRPDNALAKILDTLRRNAKDLKNLSGQQLLDDTDNVRNTVQELVFKKIDRVTICAGRGLESLQWIAQSDNIPWDIRSDAAELHHRWANNSNFTGDIMFGVIIGKDKLESPDSDSVGKTGREGLSLDKKFAKKRLHKEWGNNGLQNGQWWPYQICTIRDGAHGHTQGGISGEGGRGAYSIVIASHSDYTDGSKGDLDQGEELWYMGTPQEEGTQPTAATQYMLDACNNKKDIRVIRSHREANTSKPSIYAPQFGLRYDGLYKVVDYKLIEPANYHYRFHLVRNPGQEPIRYKGPEKRPNKHEIAAARAFTAAVAGKKRRRVE